MSILNKRFWISLLQSVFGVMFVLLAFLVNVARAQLTVKQLSWKLTQLTTKSERKFGEYEEALSLLGKRVFAMEEVLQDARKTIENQDNQIKQMAHAQLICGQS